MIVFLLILVCFNGYASYEAGKSFGNSSVSGMNKFFSPNILKSVPHYKEGDTGAPETVEELHSKATDVFENTLRKTKRLESLILRTPL